MVQPEQEGVASVAKNSQSPRGFDVPRGRGCTTGMIVSWNLYEGVSVIDHCSHCTGLDENLEDVEVTREQRAPGDAQVHTGWKP